MKKENNTFFELPGEKKKSCCPGMTRRNFIKTTGATLAGLTLPLNLISCNETPVQLPEVEPPIGDVTVGIVSKENIEEMVMRAIEIAGGLGEINKGDTVVIKPNLVLGLESTLSHRVFTHPEVLRSVIRAVKEKTDSTNITVAESSNFGVSTIAVARQTGILDMTMEEGVNFLAWETGKYGSATSESFEHIGFNLKIPNSLLDGSFDHFINVPILKNHELIKPCNVDYTCCIKNHIGVLHPFTRVTAGDNPIFKVNPDSPLSFGIHKPDLGEISAELNLAVPKHAMNIVDALTVVLSGGAASFGMEVAETGLILASKDRVACDSLAVAVLKHYAIQKGIDRPYVHKSVWDQAQIKHAQLLNLGRKRENIEIVDENVEDISGILDNWT